MSDFVKVSRYEYLMIVYCAAYLGWRTLWNIFISDQRGGLRGPICASLSILVAFLLHRHHPGRIKNE